jgi:uncharacterized protein (TIGR02145 family)
MLTPMKSIFYSLSFLFLTIFSSVSWGQLVMTDANGNDYNIVTINGKEWLGSNYKSNKFLNGDSIYFARNLAEWKKLNLTAKPAYCYLEFSAANSQSGFIYNQYAVNDRRKIAPLGWTVPTKETYVDLINHLGGSTDAFLKLASRDPSWQTNLLITNLSRFSALPLGYLAVNGLTTDKGTGAYFWTTTVNGVVNVLSLKTTGATVEVLKPGKRGKIEQGYMLRLVKQ